jgi:chromate reductase, NAD(P)H dehydrogenase (quinone)
MKIIALAGSNSSKSINHQLVSYAASQINNSEVIRLTDYNIPMYSIDVEEEMGIPKGVKDLNQKLSEADAFILSVAEHNGNISAFFKSVVDWLSRNNRKYLVDKKIVLLSTSPGKGGATSALQITQKMLPHFGAEIVATLSIGSFYNNVKEGLIVDEKLNNLLKEALSKIK